MNGVADGAKSDESGRRLPAGITDEEFEAPESGDGQPDPAQLAEIMALLTAVFDRCGYDFRDYAPASLARRVRRCVSEEGVAGIPELQELACSNQGCMDRLLNTLTLPVTSMFRDPMFFRTFRETLCPVLATYPFLRLWVAGCSTGQEAYSLAILLRETELLERSRIYVTDLHAGLLRQAQTGIYPLAVMQEYSRNYLDAGGTRSLSEYLTADAQNAMLDPALRANMVFATHNLACDGAFNEFHAILCRNVMIYFNDKLQRRVHGLLYDSLGMLGFLALGRSETIRFSHHENSYDTVSKSERIYRKAR